MFTVQVEKECGCFRKSDFKNNMQFESKDDALVNARMMEGYMNEEFCKKHLFKAVEDGDAFTIRMAERPNGGGGCCGGGHCG